MGLRAERDRRVFQRHLQSEWRDGYTFFVQVHDRGQPGSNDDFSVWIYDPNEAQVYTSGGLLSGGNIVIHDTAGTVTPPTAWYFDCDCDGYYVPAGESCTPPPCREPTIRGQLIYDPQAAHVVLNWTLGADSTATTTMPIYPEL